MPQVEQELRQLERRVDELIGLCRRLQQENRTLRDKQATLLLERADLRKKNETARAHVEAMITRLKVMEENR